VVERASQSVIVKAPVDLVYGVVTDFERYHEWASEVKRVDVHDRDNSGRPLDVEFRAAAYGRSTTYTLRYDYSRSPEELAWTQVSGDITDSLHGRYRFEALGEATRVTYDLEVELRVPIPPFIRSRAAQRIQSDALGELKARAESLS
jgi:ribosome-associated toxin RatA of RatAB toxin-antitoxin module